MDEYIIEQPFLSVKPERRSMKIQFPLPWGGEFYFERQPMDKVKFEQVCSLIGGLGGGAMVLAFVLAMISHI